MLSPIKMPFVSLLLAICLAGSAAANCPVGDLDGDCTVDWEDLKLFTQQWLNNPGDSANLNGTDGVDFTDFALLASNWQPKQPTVVLLNDSFEGAAWDANWSNDGWSPDSTQKYSGSYSAWAKDGNEGNFTCNDLNASDANAIYIDFWYRLTGDLEASDLILYYYNGSSYVEISQIGNGTEDTWLHYATTITDTQYFQSTFRIRFNAALDSGKNVWIDDVLIQKKLDSVTTPEEDRAGLVADWAALRDQLLTLETGKAPLGRGPAAAAPVPLTPPTATGTTPSKKVLTKAKAAEFKQRAGGNRAKAEAMARAEGYEF